MRNSTPSPRKPLMTCENVSSTTDVSNLQQHLSLIHFSNGRTVCDVDSDKFRWNVRQQDGPKAKRRMQLCFKTVTGRFQLLEIDITYINSDGDLFRIVWETYQKAFSSRKYLTIVDVRYAQVSSPPHPAIPFII